MKTTKMLLGMTIATVGLMVACQHPKGEVAVEDKLPTAEVAQPNLDVITTDSVVVDSTWVASQEAMEYAAEGMKPSYHAYLDVPSAEQAPLLYNALMEWVSEACLNSGDTLTDAKAMLLHDMRAQATPTDEHSAAVTTDIQIRKTYETKQFITYEVSSYHYEMGAAHGLTGTFGATFRKSDGKVFGKNLLKAGMVPQNVLKEGLKRYFEVQTDAELTERLLIDGIYSIDYLPQPATAPWVTSEGIVCIYQPYEIAPYAAGAPKVVVPLEAAQSHLTPPAKKLLK